MRSVSKRMWLYTRGNNIELASTTHPLGAMTCGIVVNKLRFGRLTNWNDRLLDATAVRLIEDAALKELADSVKASIDTFDPESFPRIRAALRKVGVK